MIKRKRDTCISLLSYLGYMKYNEYRTNRSVKGADKMYAETINKPYVKLTSVKSNKVTMPSVQYITVKKGGFAELIKNLKNHPSLFIISDLLEKDTNKNTEQLHILCYTKNQSIWTYIACIAKNKLVSTEKDPLVIEVNKPNVSLLIHRFFNDMTINPNPYIDIHDPFIELNGTNTVPPIIKKIFNNYEPFHPTKIGVKTKKNEPVHLGDYIILSYDPSNPYHKGLLLLEINQNFPFRVENGHYGKIKFLNNMNEPMTILEYNAAIKKMSINNFYEHEIQKAKGYTQRYRQTLTKQYKKKKLSDDEYIALRLWTKKRNIRHSINIYEYDPHVVHEFIKERAILKLRELIKDVDTILNQEKEMNITKSELTNLLDHHTPIRHEHRV